MQGIGASSQRVSASREGQIGHLHLLPPLELPRCTVLLAGGHFVPGFLVAADTEERAVLVVVLSSRPGGTKVVGLSRVGGIGHNGSGDIFLAYSTGNSLPANATDLMPLQMIPNHEMDPFFYAVVEATEEAILNAMIAAETIQGFQGRTVYALPHDDLCQVMRQYQRL